LSGREIDGAGTHL